MANGSSPAKSNRDEDKTPDEYFELEENGSSNHGEIKVKTFTGKIISLKVKGSDTIGSLKLKIMDEEHIPFDQQELILDRKILESIHTFANLHIKKQSTITLMRKTSETMEIFIKSFDPQRLNSGPYKVRPSDTIIHFKTEIARLYNDRHELIFNEIILENIGTFADYNISNGSVLTLILRSRNTMEIFVETPTEETISLLVDPADTIADVKSMIDCYKCIPVDEQALILNKTILADSGKLSDFNINRNSTLTLLHKSNGLMRIFIETFTGDKTVTLEVKPSDTIGLIKAKLKDEESIPCDDHELLYDDFVLHNDDTLADIQIERESTLTLMRVSTGFTHSIFVEHLCYGKSYTLDVKASDTIQDLRSKIRFKIGYLPPWQKLKFNSVFLENINGATLADYNLCNGSTIHIV